MKAKHHAGNLATLLAVSLLILSGSFLLSGDYAYSLYTLLGVVLCMEARVRMGFRNARKKLFYVHLTSSVLLIALLTFLMRGYGAYSLQPLALFLFAVMTVTGGTLLYRSHRAHQTR
jgi:hypothetical protein